MRIIVISLYIFILGACGAEKKTDSFEKSQLVGVWKSEGTSRTSVKWSKIYNLEKDGRSAVQIFQDNKLMAYAIGSWEADREEFSFTIDKTIYSQDLDVDTVEEEEEDFFMERTEKHKILKVDQKSFTIESNVRGVLWQAFFAFYYRNNDKLSQAVLVRLGDSTELSKDKSNCIFNKSSELCKKTIEDDIFCGHKAETEALKKGVSEGGWYAHAEKRCVVVLKKNRGEILQDRMILSKKKNR